MLGLGVLGGTIAQTPPLIINGDFEDPAGPWQSGWFQQSSGLQRWFVNEWPAPLLFNGPYWPWLGLYGPTALPPLQGNYDLVADEFGAGTTTLAQTFPVAIEEGVTLTRATLSWQDRLASAAPFTPGAQEVRVFLVDSEGLAFPVWSTQPTDQVSQLGPNLRGDGGQPWGFDVTPVVQSHANEELTLCFEVTARVHVLNFTVDDVALLLTYDHQQGGGTVVIDGCDTGVTNVELEPDGDLQGRIDDCAEGAKNHGQYVKAVAQLTNTLVREGVITGEEKGAIQSCAAEANIPMR